MLGKRGFPLEKAADQVCREAGARMISNVCVQDMDLAGERWQAHNGAALQYIRRRKTITYPELIGEGGRARLLVLAVEVGGRFSQGAASFVTRPR